MWIHHSPLSKEFLILNSCCLSFSAVLMCCPSSAYKTHPPIDRLLELRRSCDWYIYLLVGWLALGDWLSHWESCSEKLTSVILTYITWSQLADLPSCTLSYAVLYSLSLPLSSLRLPIVFYGAENTHTIIRHLHNESIMCGQLGYSYITTLVLWPIPIPDGILCPSMRRVVGVHIVTC